MIAIYLVLIKYFDFVKDIFDNNGGSDVNDVNDVNDVSGVIRVNDVDDENDRREYFASGFLIDEVCLPVKNAFHVNDICVNEMCLPIKNPVKNPDHARNIFIERMNNLKPFTPQPVQESFWSMLRDALLQYACVFGTALQTSIQERYGVCIGVETLQRVGENYYKTLADRLIDYFETYCQQYDPSFYAFISQLASFKKSTDQANAHQEVDDLMEEMNREADDVIAGELAERINKEVRIVRDIDLEDENKGIRVTPGASDEDMLAAVTKMVENFDDSDDGCIEILTTADFFDYRQDKCDENEKKCDENENCIDAENENCIDAEEEHQPFSEMTSVDVIREIYARMNDSMRVTDILVNSVSLTRLYHLIVIHMRGYDDYLRLLNQIDF
jgi:hypothetical protein